MFVCLAEFKVFTPRIQYSDYGYFIYEAFSQVPFLEAFTFSASYDFLFQHFFSGKDQLIIIQ
jgi:hypothetical protein